MKHHSDPLQSFAVSAKDEEVGFSALSGSARSKRLLGVLAVAVGGFGLIYHGLSEKPAPSEDAALDCSSPRDAWRWACHREESRTAQLSDGRSHAGEQPGTTGSVDSRTRASTAKGASETPTPAGVTPAVQQEVAEAEPQTRREEVSTLPASPPAPPRRPVPESRTQNIQEAAADPAQPKPRQANRLADTYRAMIETRPTPPERPLVEEPAAAERPVVARTPEKPVEALIRDRRETAVREIPRVAAPPVARKPAPALEAEPVVRRAERVNPPRSGETRTASNFPPEFLNVLRGYNMSYSSQPGRR
jgi:hypothetical protein